MAMLNFDATTVQPNDSFSPIPAGDYIAQITNSELKPTKAGNGMILNLTWTVLDGMYANRKIFDRVNVQNQNPEAEKIGQRQLSSICHTLGVMKLQDSNQLHGKPCKIKVKIRQDAQWGDSNEVKGYEAMNGFVAPAQSSYAQPAQQQAPQQSSSTPPWARSAS